MATLLFSGFLFLLLLFHFIAVKLKKQGISKNVIHNIEYTYLFVAVLSLSGIYSLDALGSKNEAKYLTHYLERVHGDIQSRVNWGISFYSRFGDIEYFGYKTGFLSGWFGETKSFHEKEYDQQKWRQFINSNEELFRKIPQDDAALILKWMNEYMDKFNEKRRTRK